MSYGALWDADEHGRTRRCVIRPFPMFRACPRPSASNVRSTVAVIERGSHDTMPNDHAPDMARITATVIGWLMDPAHGSIAAQVAGWGDADWEAARWAIQVHGIGPLLDRAAERWPDAGVLHP